MTQKDNIATAKFVIRNVLVEHSLFCSNVSIIEVIVNKLYEEITSGSCSHAFKKILNPEPSYSGECEYCKKIHDLRIGCLESHKLLQSNCKHHWVSARNEVVKSGEVCTECLAMREET